MSLSDYHQCGSFDKKKRREIVARAVKDLRNVEFDALAVRGVSGLILAPIVAYILNKYVIVVRKDKKIEPSHAYESVETPIAKGKYVIFDDFVAGGFTVDTIVTQIAKTYPSLVPVGGFTWKPGRPFPNGKFTNIRSLNKT